MRIHNEARIFYVQCTARRPLIDKAKLLKNLHNEAPALAYSVQFLLTNVSHSCKLVVRPVYIHTSGVRGPRTATPFHANQKWGLVLRDSTRDVSQCAFLVTSGPGGSRRNTIVSKNFVVYQSRNRMTGTLCQTLDTKHAASTLPFNEKKRYAARCVEHGKTVLFAEHYDAGRAIAHVDEWCPRCRKLIAQGKRVKVASSVPPVNGQAMDKEWNAPGAKSTRTRKVQPASIPVGTSMYEITGIPAAQPTPTGASVGTEVQA